MIRALAYISGITLPTFPTETTQRLDQLVRKPVTGKLITTEHRRVIAQICVEAKRAGIQIERLIVFVKDVVDKAPPSEDGILSRAELKDRLVSVCVEEYFHLDGSSKG